MPLIKERLEPGMTLLILVSLLLLVASAVWSIRLALRSEGVPFRVFAGFLVFSDITIRKCDAMIGKKLFHVVTRASQR